MRTPYFVCDAELLRENCERVDEVRQRSQVKILYAMKSMSSTFVFRHMRSYFDGVVASSVYEARLGREHLLGEGASQLAIHTYSPGFSERELDEVSRLSDVVILNSLSQLRRHSLRVRSRGRGLGLRLNPEVGGLHDGADGLNFCGRHSRLGVRRRDVDLEELRQVDGVLFHVNSENASLSRLARVVRAIEATFGDVLALPNIRWISLGGGISFTEPDYPRTDFAQLLRNFAREWSAEVYLEPGSAVSSRPFSLHATVLDLVRGSGSVPIAVLNISAEAHLPDRMLFGIQYPIVGATLCDAQVAEGERLDGARVGEHLYVIAGVSCLGSDEFGLYRFAEPLAVGDEVIMTHTGDYTMVQQNHFNGVRRPDVYFRHNSGEIEAIKRYSYEDFLSLCR